MEINRNSTSRIRAESKIEVVKKISTYWIYTREPAKGNLIKLVKHKSGREKRMTTNDADVHKCFKGVRIRKL